VKPKLTRIFDRVSFVSLTFSKSEPCLQTNAIKQNLKDYISKVFTSQNNSIPRLK